MSMIQAANVGVGIIGKVRTEFCIISRSLDE